MLASVGTAPPPLRDGASLTETDRRFLLVAASSGLYEVDAARLAEQRAADPVVKAYAAMLVAQRSTLNAELEALARARGVLLPQAAPDNRRMLIEALGALDANLFDRGFVQQVGISGHHDDVLLFDQASRGLVDPELRAWAAHALPILQAQLIAAQRLRQPERALLV